MSDDADAWARLDAELGAWAAPALQATLWWRDDDAGAPRAALERLLEIARRYDVPLVLAVVPAWAQRETAAMVGRAAQADIVQHGYAHANPAPPGERKSELGPERPAPIVIAELAQGWQQLETLFGGRFFPALVPPWNRMAPYLPPFLAELRYKGVSQFGPRSRPEPVRGLAQGNTHVDILHWKSGLPRFAGTLKSLDEMTWHLAARRHATADPAEPTGLLTHHAAHDEPSWQFLDQLLGRLARHPRVRWLGAAEVFGAARR